ncbi:hypothetical protein ERICIV_03122 [Paenibacillus larvae subsp. larvae]|uniref:Uncharacterized protein n=1 Tax=Paenibacillus larvae subsp. larvae TaxID=147375 RepID=A0A2L1U388_9BACL|nr:hypothetical protein [Paenibacillus larvae]AQT83931.1 hypothetical protein B1222_05210 [Paenibacillus larvae subsp. pulvifaciens]AQZ45384.1 hypothetical protein B5S25_01030 [Paenibacillus larvae subsp. pulvifaciens]AVF27338.1 hypothetical protein ERICIII_03219 [Paenibacillus larvae subsp. larvae]AVF32001.1 hypothetical protein ERICIV_03122 [Paenibacillus larvae subsp. larvae]MBH0343397.1 hypothetical protein [Paenibacillus larvae]
MAEKNILAYFNTPEQAKEVASKLNALRAEDVQIDRFGRYLGVGVDDVMNPITGNFSSLGNLTLGANFANRSSAIMAAADTSASGMSDGGQGGPNGKDILLTAVVDESIHEQALQIIRDSGGIV